MDEARCLRLHAGEDLVEGFEEVHLGTDLGEQTRKLETDGAGPDDRYSSRLRRPIEGMVGGDDSLSVGLVAGDAPRHRTRGNDHLARLETLWSLTGNVDDARTRKAPGPGHDLHLALFEQAEQPLVELGDDGILALEGPGPIEGRKPRDHAHVGRTGHLGEDLSGVDP